MKICLAALFFGLWIAHTIATQLSVDLRSNSDKPVFQAVVYLEPTEKQDFPVPEQVSVMDQIESQFVPHILAVQKGSMVSFPNSDSIKHHVYSFSPANVFELKLYKDTKLSPIAFQKSGEVELGCNVHDWMLGYILVVDTPYFAKTDQSGQVTLDAPAGQYTLKVWHPRIQDDQSVLTQTINLDNDQQIKIALKQDLLEDLVDFNSAQDEFSDYE